jgi:hypothetical protein
MRESLIAEVERGLVFFDGEDNKIWKSHSSNVYTVSSGCHLLDGFIVSIILYGSGREAQELKTIQWDIKARYKNIYSIMRKREFQTRQSQMGDKK